MNCREISNELSAYIDGELSSDMNREIETHLSGCSSCRETQDMLLATSVAFRCLVPRRVSPDFSENIQAGVDTSASRSLFSWRRATVPVALAASLILVFFWNQDEAGTLSITDQLLVMELVPAVIIPESEPYLPCQDPRETMPVFGLADSI